ncbi:hypothetical protein D7X33_12920 [Butyricicoccus sp. 1XD8-22]|nr:hypothetical protein D7X33_12920 [Butyricicoccus sp. 1XD8-22]
MKTARGAGIGIAAYGLESLSPPAGGAWDCAVLSVPPAGVKKLLLNFFSKKLRVQGRALPLSAQDPGVQGAGSPWRRPRRTTTAKEVMIDV